MQVPKNRHGDVRAEMPGAFESAMEPAVTAKLYPQYIPCADCCSQPIVCYPVAATILTFYRTFFPTFNSCMAEMAQVRQGTACIGDARMLVNATRTPAAETMPCVCSAESFRRVHGNNRSISGVLHMFFFD